MPHFTLKQVVTNRAQLTLNDLSIDRIIVNNQNPDQILYRQVIKNNVAV